MRTLAGPRGSVGAVSVEKKKKKKEERKKKRGERKKRANAPLCVCAGSRVTWLHGYERCSRIGASTQSGDSCRANNGQRDGNRYGNPESRLVGRQDGREFPPDPIDSRRRVRLSRLSRRASFHGKRRY